VKIFLYFRHLGLFANHLACGKFPPDALCRSTVTLMHRRPLLVALSLTLLAASPGACTGPASIPPPPPPAVEAPLFATDEEALEAATAAYAEFLAVSGQILRDGGSDPERLKPLVSDEVYESEAEGFRTFVMNGYSARGNATLESVALQQHNASNDGFSEIQIFACVSLEDVDVLDATGQSVVNPDRTSRLEYEALFISTRDEALILERESVWDGGGICGQ
jgi:hypothetical protein